MKQKLEDRAATAAAIAEPARQMSFEELETGLGADWVELLKSLRSRSPVREITSEREFRAATRAMLAHHRMRAESARRRAENDIAATFERQLELEHAQIVREHNAASGFGENSEVVAKVDSELASNSVSSDSGMASEARAESAAHAGHKPELIYPAQSEDSAGAEVSKEAPNAEFPRKPVIRRAKRAAGTKLQTRESHKDYESKFALETSHTAAFSNGLVSSECLCAVCSDSTSSECLCAVRSHSVGSECPSRMGDRNPSIGRKPLDTGESSHVKPSGPQIPSFTSPDETPRKPGRHYARPRTAIYEAGPYLDSGDRRARRMYGSQLGEHGHLKRIDIHPTVQLNVMLRDSRRCSHVDPGGRRCEQRTNLEIHHVIEVKRGVTNEESNSVVLCRAHHQRRHPDIDMSRRRQTIMTRMWTREEMEELTNKKGKK